MDPHYLDSIDTPRTRWGRRRRLLRGGLAGLIVVVLVASGVLARKAESVEYRIRALLAERQPHPEFVPTPITVEGFRACPECSEGLKVEGLTSGVEIQALPMAWPVSTPNVELATSNNASPPSTPNVERSTLNPSLRSRQAVQRLTPPLAPVGTSYSLTQFKHEYQTWNNCGPATVAMNLSYYGRTETQADIAHNIKPDKDDKNVSPGEMVAYAQSLGFEGWARVNGDFGKMKQFIANDLPVIVETWFTPKPNDGMGHYRLLTGWDDAAGYFQAFDSYNGPNVKLPYAALDADWRVFNRTYVVLYPPEKADVVTAIVGEDTDDRVMYRRALAVAQAEAARNPSDPFAWFNVGSSLASLERFVEAADAFDRARTLGLPWRMLWYQFGPFEAYLAVGRFQEVIALADANLKTAGDLEESYYYRGLALRALGQADQARWSFQMALRFNQNFAPAAQALQTNP